MKTEDCTRLLGDIGGTNARFAWQCERGAAPIDVATYACADHDSIVSAIRHYLIEHGKRPPRECAIGIANPITGDLVRMTNHHWSFSIAELQRELGLERLVVINDFTALALSLPALKPSDLLQVGGGTVTPGAAMAVLGPGTGLGVSGLLSCGRGGFAPINGEGGHVTLAASNDWEAAIIDRLRSRFGHVSAERALSGPGLVHLYEAVCAQSNHATLALSPAEVIARARSAGDPHCGAAIDLFCNLLGGVAGNLALTLGARGGVYIGGGIAPRMVHEIRRSSFRERFESKGRFCQYLKDIPTYVIDTEISQSLVGAARALDHSRGVKDPDTATR
jgi:glucokinase